MMHDYSDAAMDAHMSPPPPPPPPAPPSKCSKCLGFFRSVFGFLFSHIGLLSLVVGYSILGAFIFEELERENELETKRGMTKRREAVTETLWALTK